jgi:YD repeat-containing protein
VKFARVITPDSRTKAKIVFSLIGKHGRNICMTVVFAHSGGGCAVGLLLRPFNLMTMSRMDPACAECGGVVLAGAASDDVNRMELFLPHGRHRIVPLKDNAFLVTVTTADSPVTLVAYDSHGLIIGRTAPRLAGGLR